jgi:hypothetical protein
MQDFCGETDLEVNLEDDLYSDGIGKMLSEE